MKITLSNIFIITGLVMAIIGGLFAIEAAGGIGITLIIFGGVGKGIAWMAEN